MPPIRKGHAGTEACKKKGRCQLKERIITGVIGAALFVSMVIFGGPVFTLFIALVATVAMTELLKMKKIEVFTFKGKISLVLLWIILIPINWFDLITPLSVTKLQLFLAGAVLLLGITVISKNKFSFDQVGFVLLSSLYVGFGFHFLISARGDSTNGLLLVFFLLFLIWTTDSAAYFVGKRWGKHKLWPEISPKKTIEGSIGGIIAALIIGSIFFFVVPALFETYTKAIMVILVVSIFGQMGDLVQSAFKRHYGVKDSGTILPGHGGILDRFDSLIYVMIILYIVQLI